MTDHALLNRFFSRSTLSDLIKNIENAVYTNTIRKYVNNATAKENLTLIREVYRIIAQTYRNEYYYKNTLLNKLLLGVHSLNTTTALAEIAVYKAKADFVLINGHAVVYEIKTELDTLDRLQQQLDNYYKAFTHVTVVTCESNCARLEKMLRDTPAGINILTNRNMISERKKPLPNDTKLDIQTMFKLLRKREFENILRRHYGQLPDTKPVHYYDACLQQLQAIDKRVVYENMLAELKQRRPIDIAAYKKFVPYELRSLVYFTRLNRGDMMKLDRFLNTVFGG